MFHGAQKITLQSILQRKGLGVLNVAWVRHRYCFILHVIKVVYYACLNNTCAQSAMTHTCMQAMQLMWIYTLSGGLGLQDHAHNAPPDVLVIIAPSKLVQLHSLLLLARKVEASAANTAAVPDTAP